MSSTVPNVFSFVVHAPLKGTEKGAEGIGYGHGFEFQGESSS